MSLAIDSAIAVTFNVMLQSIQSLANTQLNARLPSNLLHLSLYQIADSGALLRL